MFFRSRSSNSIHVFLWRFFTGAHLNGRQYTNAGWFRHGTAPKQALTWWTAQPRIKRAGIRAACIIIPAAIFYLYTEFRYWTLFSLLAVAPYLLHHGSLAVVKRAAPVKKVKVRETQASQWPDVEPVDLTNYKVGGDK